MQQDDILAGLVSPACEIEEPPRISELLHYESKDTNALVPDELL